MIRKQDCYFLNLINSIPQGPKKKDKHSAFDLTFWYKETYFARPGGHLFPFSRLSRWKPKKDFDANRLQSGLLQLAPGTLLVLDETQMETGTLDEAGVQAVQARQQQRDLKRLFWLF